MCTLQLKISSFLREKIFSVQLFLIERRLYNRLRKLKHFTLIESTALAVLFYIQLFFIAALESGGDDYVTKPIKPKVLLSRINAILRRTEAKGISQINGIQIDYEKYIVYKNGEEILLPKKEFELLSLLMSKPDHVFRRNEILNSVWGTEIIVGDRTIDVHIRKLRRKLGDAHISTIKGVGYKYNT